MHKATNENIRTSLDLVGRAEELIWRNPREVIE